MQTQIDRLNSHVVICGDGRIWVQLAMELEAARGDFVVIEREVKTGGLPQP